MAQQPKSAFHFFMTQKKTTNSLINTLQELLASLKEKDPELGAIFQILSERGYAAMLFLFSFPFCFPITIPGLSTPFGFAIAYIGLRLAFGHGNWLPSVLMKKKISHSTLKKVSEIAIGTLHHLRFLISSRLTWFVKNPKLHVIHGLTITFLACCLALPLPIPFSNTVSALPLACFGLALLEDDGLFILIAYFFTLICFTFFVLLAWFGKSGITFILSYVGIV
ncbi:putative exopolysaccharide synthesis protein [Chlamydiales bacterium STE3]|nr:putative exopolysaccharide synthesis protein [Chlamydiales bacterium STE3]